MFSSASTLRNCWFYCNGNAVSLRPFSYAHRPNVFFSFFLFCLSFRLFTGSFVPLEEKGGGVDLFAIFPSSSFLLFRLSYSIGLTEFLFVCLFVFCLLVSVSCFGFLLSLIHI